MVITTAPSKPLQITFRRYRQSDDNAIFSLHVLVLKADNVYIGGARWDDDLKNIDQVYLQNGGEFVVAENYGEMVAMGALKRLCKTDAELKRIRVHPLYRRQGLAQMLLYILQDRAVELGYRVLRLDTLVQQIAAQQLYRKNCFVETGRTVLGGMDAVLFEKRLL